jgi:hypothetical protein
MLLYRIILPGRSKRRIITFEGVPLHIYHLQHLFQDAYTL